MPYSDPDRNREWQREWMRNRRLEAKQYLGDACAMCGITGGLEFDHIDPSSKSCPISALLSYRWETLAAELDKCQLLCEACHVEKSRADGSHARGASGGRGTAKLAPEDVLEIRELLGEGCLQREIAEAYGVSRTAVGNIHTGKYWAWV